jgi:hypothetical protein
MIRRRVNVAFLIPMSVRVQLPGERAMNVDIAIDDDGRMTRRAVHRRRLETSAQRPLQRKRQSGRQHHAGNHALQR